MCSRFVAAFAAVTSAAVALTGIAAPAAHGASDGTGVKIGLEAPLSGDQKILGQGMLEGAKLAAATWTDAKNRYVLVSDAGMAAVKQLL